MKSLQLSVSNKCLRNCKGCYNFFSDNDDVIDYKVLVDFIKQLQQDIGLQKVTITGGDPLYRNDLPLILKALKNLGLKINLDTTGLRLLDNTYDISFITKYVDLLGIPLDGITDSGVKEFRHGIDKPIETILQILHKLQDNGINTCINTMVHKLNVDTVAEMPKIMSGFDNIIKWQLFQYMPIGPSSHTIKQQMYISEEDFNNTMNQARQQSSLLNHKICIESKNIQSRLNKYVFVSPKGVVWAPDVQNFDERIIVGNITSDYQKIIKFIK